VPITPAGNLNAIQNATVRAMLLVEGQPERPPTLYHFTDVPGLVGTLTNGCLWASLATTLNDSSELSYGVDLAARLVKEQRAKKNTSYLRALDYMLGMRERSPVFTSGLEVFVASFCARADKSVHRLHYGRSGGRVEAGVAQLSDSRARQRPRRQERGHEVPGE
jgi:hypothetical protein